MITTDSSDAFPGGADRLSGLEPSAWVDRHGDALYRFALLRLRNPDLAENAVQETFLAALGARSSFSGRSSVRTWLVGILKRKIVDHFRRLAREAPAAEVDDGNEPTETLFDEKGKWRVPPARWGAAPGDELERAQFWRALEHCIKALPERMARAFALVEMDEGTGEEACKVLGVTATNLWVMLHRARRRLRSCIEETWFVEDREGQ